MPRKAKQVRWFCIRCHKERFADDVEVEDGKTMCIACYSRCTKMNDKLTELQEKALVVLLERGHNVRSFADLAHYLKLGAKRGKLAAASICYGLEKKGLVWVCAAKDRWSSHTPVLMDDGKDLARKLAERF